MEPIWYFNAAIEEKDLAYVKRAMQAHGVRLHKSNDDPNDHWWFFPLPDGTTKVKKNHPGEIPHYTVHLPDGFTFTLEIGPLGKDGLYTSPPQIFLDPLGKAET